MSETMTLRRLKEATCGCAGIFNAPVALQSYLSAHLSVASSVKLRIPRRFVKAGVRTAGSSSSATTRQ
jgi:hypothetical protein